MQEKHSADRTARFYAGVLVILACVLLQGGSTVLFKTAATHLKAYSAAGIITNIFYLSAILVLITKAVLWQLALRRFPLSRAYPLLSFHYVMILIVGDLMFHEAVTIGNVAGCALIITGVMFILRDKGYLYA